MKPPFQASLWFPTTVLVVTVVIVLSLLMAAERASMNETAASYPPPAPACVFLPLIERGGGLAIAADDPTAEYAPTPAEPAAYPPPSQCARPTVRTIYLPVVRR